MSCPPSQADTQPSPMRYADGHLTACRLFYCSRCLGPRVVLHAGLPLAWQTASVATGLRKAWTSVIGTLLSSAFPSRMRRGRMLPLAERFHPGPGSHAIARCDEVFKRLRHGNHALHATRDFGKPYPNHCCRDAFGLRCRNSSLALVLLTRRAFAALPVACHKRLKGTPLTVCSSTLHTRLQKLEELEQVQPKLSTSHPAPLEETYAG